MIHVTAHISIDESALSEQFIRAAGPGGQNVNKVASAVQLRFDLRQCPSLPADVRDRLIRLAGRRATREGEIIVEASEFRHREQNRQAALGRLIDLIRRAAVKPTPRRPTKPSRSSRQRRLESKHRRSTTKKSRRVGDSDE